MSSGVRDRYFDKLTDDISCCAVRRAPGRFSRCAPLGLDSAERAACH